MAARKAATKNRNGQRLEEAVATLINNPALLVNTQVLFVGQMAKTDVRFTRIESELEEIRNILRNREALLMQHQRMLESLPEAIRQKIGFVKSRYSCNGDRAGSCCPRFSGMPGSRRQN